MCLSWAALGHAGFIHSLLQLRMLVYQHCASCIASSHANRRNVLQVVTVHQPNASINHPPLWVCHRPRRRHPREGSTHHTGIPLHHPHPTALEGDMPCLPTPGPAPALLPSKQLPVRLWCPGGQLAASFAASLLFEDILPHHNRNGDLPALGLLLAHLRPAMPARRVPGR